MISVSGSAPSKLPVREAIAGAPQVAFILPAFNEEGFIAGTLSSIHEVAADVLSYEIVVADNGSVDRTVELARAHGARTLVEPAATVGRLRNLGVQQSSAPVLVFLDADVVLTRQWGAHITATLARLAHTPLLVTGSLCGVPDDAHWIERYWFEPRTAGVASHINGAHLIMTRVLFDRLGGFDESKQTGEDYELSERALSAGAELRQNPRLSVQHLGYPRSLRAFVRREIWHGRSDSVSLRALLRSKVAVSAGIFFLLHVAAVISVVLGRAWLAGGAIGSVVAQCATASITQYRGQRWTIIACNTVLYYFYFWGRAIALLRAASGRTSFLPRELR